MIKLDNICSGYGKKQVLSNISIELERGKLISVVGPNGCGKSTLLKSIAGLLSITSGALTIDGDTVSELGRNDVAKRVAYLAQSKSVPDMTVGQMVLHGRFPHLSYPRRYGENDRLIAEQAMRKTGILELSEQPVRELSGGMRQNAYVAMALAQSTDFILLDEPTTYLDIARQLELMQTLKELASDGKGVVAVLHDIPLALGYSDELIVIDGGRVAATGTPEEIYRSGITEKIFGVPIGISEDGSSFCYKYGASNKDQ